MKPDDRPVKIAIVGPGKIARDQHVPAINASPDFELVASVANRAGLEGYPVFGSVTEMVESGLQVDAVAICTPPQVRREVAMQAIDAGLDVLLEKPPAMTPGAFEEIRAYAADKGIILFATWHSRFGPMVDRTRDLIAERGLASARIVWREDAHQWHPGQTWLWEPGGLGVFDPGINALSILTKVCPGHVVVQEAAFEVPANWYSPIGARLAMKVGEAPVDVDLDFRQKGQQSWDIHFECLDGSTIDLAMGGSVLTIDGEQVGQAEEAEYPGIYAWFADLLNKQESDADGSPLQIVADAFLIARTSKAENFTP